MSSVEDETRSSVSCCTEFMRKNTRRRRTVSRRPIVTLNTHDRKSLNAGVTQGIVLTRTLSAIFEPKVFLLAVENQEHFLRHTLIARVVVLPRGSTYTRVAHPGNPGAIRAS
jgi:hypothetical protein